MPQASADRDKTSRAGPLTTVLGPVRTAAGWSPAAAKARVSGSENRNSGSLNPSADQPPATPGSTNRTCRDARRGPWMTSMLASFLQADGAATRRVIGRRHPYLWLEVARDYRIQRCGQPLRPGCQLAQADVGAPRSDPARTPRPAPSLASSQTTSTSARWGGIAIRTRWRRPAA
jgi:hypothetical protein